MSGFFISPSNGLSRALTILCLDSASLLLVPFLGGLTFTYNNLNLHQITLSYNRRRILIFFCGEKMHLLCISLIEFKYSQHKLEFLLFFAYTQRFFRRKLDQTYRPRISYAIWPVRLADFDTSLDTAPPNTHHQ